jgi:hypothetical protein
MEYGTKRRHGQGRTYVDLIEYAASGTLSKDGKLKTAKKESENQENKSSNGLIPLYSQKLKPEQEKTIANSFY